MKQPIGIFDSGVGGTSIWKEIRTLLPFENTIYLADSKNAPYGAKPQKEILRLSIKNTELLLEKGCKLIVVACNTATGIAIDELRERFDIPFVGVEPFINALSKHKWESGDSGCVITTDLMSKTERFKNLKIRLDPDGRLCYRATPGLASIIEDFFSSKNEQALRQELEKELSFVKEESYTHLILGCTHYPLIRKYIEEVAGVKTLSPCPYVASRTLSLLKKVPDSSSLSISSFQFAETKHDQALRFVSKDFSSLP